MVLPIVGQTEVIEPHGRPRVVILLNFCTKFGQKYFKFPTIGNTPTLDEIMRVLEGTVTLLEGDKVVEVTAGGYHFRPRGVIHTFWNGHDEPAKFLDMYPSTQDFAHYLEELAQLGEDMQNEGVNPFAPENMARFKALDARYNHEVFYELMPEHIAKYGVLGA